MNSQAKPQSTGFFNKDTAGGIVLMGAALLALIVNNTALTNLYTSLLNVPVVFQLGGLLIDKPLLLWVNDGLMAIFFFLVGLEIKREVLDGELSSFDKAALPLIAAVGGMALPALVFVGVNLGTPENLNGWAIPAATDIAFALGILALMGPGVPVALKVLLLGIAIIDDLGAILAIAIFYTENVSFSALGYAAIGFAILVAFNKMGIKNIAPYILIGLIVWAGVLKSGVHATLAGVMIAMTIPMKGKDGHHSPLEHLEHGLHPWVAYMILPIFAFFNAGVKFEGLAFSDLLAPLPIGIALGLFVGKQIGVFCFSYAAVKAGICRLPTGVNWSQVYGVACLTGVGFTMSLFIGNLAFDTPEQLNAVRLGVIMGSVLSAIAGVFALKSGLASSKDKFPNNCAPSGAA